MEIKYLVRAIYWLLLILLGGILAYALNECFNPTESQLSTIVSIFLRALGALSIVYGVILNIIAGRTLRLYGHKTKTQRFRQPDVLVSVGIYSCMRHPGLWGLTVIGIGFSLVVGGISGLIAGFLPLSGGLLFILSVEEPETRLIFREKYCCYELNVKPFNLSLHCLLKGIRFLLT